ncbi:carbohydrate ABC transporter permease [Devosia algicola]|uniref:Carbohydrate ABC transporter permease n=1 Tax=Devosia algicola TaxID=3026418 RepID=A0ABY7YL86_9HYPH|nr:carbohydrate ABC transporter permease [Devosia algicola]WDR01952.1 carbohydrate ABC transporter permease [Devosia algicola]
MKHSLANMLRPSGILGVIAQILLLVWLFMTMYPIVYLFFTSLKTDSRILNSPFSIPLSPVIENYAAVILGGRTNQSVMIYMMNSFIVTGGALLVLLAASSLAGYALARGKFPGNQAAQQLFLLALAVPAHVLLIPIYFFFGDLGLRNSQIGMILLYATLGLPFTTILMRAYFVSFPKELEEAARLDGCSMFGVFWRVVLPVSRGALASMVIINIGWIWSELFFALALLDKLDVRTLPLAIAAYRPDAMATETVIGELFAIMSLAVLPLLIFYLVFQRQIRKGMTAGAIK